VQENNYQELLEAIYEGLLSKKGNNILSMDLTGIEAAVCKNFVICSADSTTQVNALARSVVEEVQERTGERIWRKEGFENSTWIILDYADVVVHIFQTETREFYQLESLWADAKTKTIE